MNKEEKNQIIKLLSKYKTLLLNVLKELNNSSEDLQSQL